MFAALLGHSRMNLVKESAWTISNILAGNQEQIQAAIDAGVIQPLITVLKLVRKIGFNFLNFVDLAHCNDSVS